MLTTYAGMRYEMLILPERSRYDARDTILLMGRNRCSLLNVLLRFSEPGGGFRDVRLVIYLGGRLPYEGEQCH